MGRLSIKSILAAAALVGLASQAHANVTFSVGSITTIQTSPVSLSGSFTTNDARSALISFDINVPASGAYQGFEYTTANSSVSSVLPAQYFRLDSGTNELQFYFTSPLTASGTTLLSTNSYDHELSGGNRLLSGSIVPAAPTPTPTPEPLSLALVGAGLFALIGVKMWARRPAGRAAV